MSRVIAAFAQFFDGEGDPLEKGWLKFLVTDTNNTLKNTYADANLTIPNSNPVQLDAEGRCPNVFGQGAYKVISYYNNPVTNTPGAQLQEFDPVIADFMEEGDCAHGNFSEWDAEVTYQVSQIVIYNARYYRSITAGNINNPPDTNPDHWEEITFLRFWNTNVTYLTGDVVIYSNALYFSLADANQGNIPLSSPTWWDPVGSGTVLTNWIEAGTNFRPTATGYDLGATGYRIGTAWIQEFGFFPETPAAAPLTDYEVANKKYADDLAAGRMRWLGLWVPDTYLENDVVTDDNWLMVANQTTTERPAPQPVGDAEWIRDLFTPPAFSTGSDTQSVLYIGQRYLFTPPAFTISGLRVYFPSAAAGLEVEFWAIYDPDGANQRIINLYPGFTIAASDTEIWLEIPVGNPYVEDGTTIDVIMVFRQGTGLSSFTYEWDYIRANGDPLPGDIHHQSGNDVDQIRIHKEDTSLIDRSTNLDLIGPGSTLKMVSSGYIWEVLEASKTGDVYTFIVDPGARASNATSDFTFTYYPSTSISYVYNTNLYSSDSRIKGFFSSEYDPGEPTYLDENGYGLDIRIQAMTSSDHWDVMSRPSTGGGTSSDAATVGGYTPEEIAILAENETVTGDWTFSGTILFGGIDAADFAVVNQNETITGDWDFTGALEKDGGLVYSESNGPMVEDAITNGRFDVWQRGTSFTSEGWTADRFYAGFSGATITCSQQTFTPGQTDVPGEPKYFYRINCTVADDLWFVAQPIEDVRRYAGQEVTLSVWMKANTSLSCQLRLVQNFGGGGSTSVMLTKNITLTTSWDEYFFTTTLGSISGKTIGTDSYLGAYFVQPNNTTGYFDIADVRLNPGPDILPVRQKSYGDVFFDCIRHYESRQGDIAGYMTKSNDNFRSWDFTFSAEKYSTPTITPTGSGFTPTVSAANKKSFRLYYNSGDTTTERVLTGWVAEAEIPI